MYLSNVTQIDEAVCEIVSELKNAGIYDDTLIWYTSDNGPEGQHEYGAFNNENKIGRARYRGSTGGLRGRKRHTHEGGIRVPGIISWPAEFERNGLKAGRVSAEPIIGSDIFPTLLEIVGIDLPADLKLDGVSILPLLKNNEFHRDRPLYWRNKSKAFRIALRDGDWKIVANSDRTVFELFNLVVDPRETSDQSAHERELFQRMKKLLVDYDNEVLQEGPDWWNRDAFVKNMPVATQ